MTTAQVPNSAATNHSWRHQPLSLAQLWQVPTFWLGLLAFVAVAASAPLRQDPDWTAFQDTLALFRRELSPPTPHVEPLLPLADQLLAQLGQYPNHAAEIHFLVGSMYYQLAAEVPPPRQEETRQQALRHLEEALALGVAEGDQSHLLYRLGQTLFANGKDYARVVEVLSQVDDKAIDQPAVYYETLLQAHLHLTPPDLTGALAANQKLLEVAENEEAKTKAWLQRGEILVRKERRLEAIKALERVTLTAPRPIRLQARLLQTRCCEEEGLWRRAVPLWRELLQDADAVPGGRARILYALGLCHHNSDPSDDAEAVKAWQQALALGGAEGQAAGLRLGELHLAASPADINQTMAAWTKALDKVQAPNDYQNRLVELGRARELFEAALRLARDNQDFNAAHQLVELYRKVAATGVADERLAQVAQSRATQLQEKAAQEKGPQASSQLAEARTLLRQAAEAFERAAESRVGSDRIEMLWQSALCYLPAKEALKAALVLEKYVQAENKEPRLAEGWLHLAEAYQALDQKDKARQAFYKCLEIPDTHFAYKARYQLALGEIDRKNFDQAQAILKQNLANTGTAVDRAAHEQSLYKLASLIWQSQNYDQACFFLKQALQQYPHHAEALTVRDQLGDCYLKLAEAVAKKMQGLNVEANSHHRRTRQRWLEQAMETYQSLADDLENRARQEALSATEKRLGTKAIFTVADVRFELGEYPDALRRYEQLCQKYKSRIEMLDACQGIWRCVGVMIDTPDQARLAREAARGAVRLALADLDKIPTEAFQNASGKEQWQKWLTYVNNQLNPGPPSQPNPSPMNPMAEPKQGN